MSGDEISLGEGMAKALKRCEPNFGWGIKDVMKAASIIASVSVKGK